jgi:hypothetical protein
MLENSFLFGLTLCVEPLLFFAAEWLRLSDVFWRIDWLNAARHFSWGVVKMSMQCPICRSHQLVTLDRAKQVGGLLGTVGGAMSGWAASSSGAAMGAELGATVGVLGGPVSIAAGSVGGALLGALVWAATGGVTGAKLGQVIDQKVLQNYVCQNCGLQFGDVHADQPFE